MRFLYVIYETKRFRKGSEWNQLLRESDVPESTRVVVLSGESVDTYIRKNARKRKSNRLKKQGKIWSKRRHC